MSETKIHLLPQHLINQIAAGEVVERPASVVKELVENAIDAGAKNIRVDIENGGLNLIKVTDDGSGMSREDAEKSILQHATSKILMDEDLQNINTLGFRGEALASISSVSEFSLLTKDEESLVGTSLVMKENGLQMSDASSPRGTSICARNLFQNVPARRKYLKTAITEFNHIVDLFFEFCLAYPGIFWKLAHNNKTVYQFPSTTILQRVGDVLGDEVARNLLEIDVKLNDILVRGFVGKPQIGRNNRKLQYLYINNRPVREFIVAKQIKDAFGTLLPRDIYPVYILNLQLDTDKIDVNVHPRKLEVRFSDPQIVYRTIYHVVSRILDESNLTMKVSAATKLFTPIVDVLQNKQQKIRMELPSNGFKQAEREDWRPSFTSRTSPKVESFLAALPDVLAKKDNVPEKAFEVLGQVENSYLVVKTANSIKIYDQHASSERVQYEKIKQEWQSPNQNCEFGTGQSPNQTCEFGTGQAGQLPRQALLIPQNLEFSPQEARLVEENLDIFGKLGFEMTGFGGNSFAVSSVPRFLQEQDIRQLVHEILGSLAERAQSEDVGIETLEKILKIMSCRSAIKFGDQLSLSSMEALIQALEANENRYTCVHGRPCVLEFTFDELERLFKRK